MDSKSGLRIIGWANVASALLLAFSPVQDTGDRAWTPAFRVAHDALLANGTLGEHDEAINEE